jgi:hypothetical protein
MFISQKKIHEYQEFGFDMFNARLFIFTTSFLGFEIL